MQKKEHYQILVIGGGTAGITVAARLLRKNKKLDIGLIEPSEQHYYQPAWALAAAGAFDINKTVRAEKGLIPKGVTWLKHAVTQLDPDNNTVETNNGGKFTYDFLALAPGIQIDWQLVKGLPEAIGKNGVCSIYDFKQAQKTWETIRNFQGGNAIFTSPSTPIKCGGAPQKIMYLADDAFRKAGTREKSRITFATAGAVIFGVKGFAETLTDVVNRKDIEVNFHHDLKAIKTDSKEAIFIVSKSGETQEVGLKYDMLHVVPPMSAPAFVKESKLAIPEGPNRGWIDVDPHSLQHNRYKNVFGLGDAAGLATAKTGAAVRKQAPVVARNLIEMIEHDSVDPGVPGYNGYSSCPLITGYGKVLLAEFSYNNKPAPSFPFDQTKERFSMWLLKKYGLPYFYWNLMLKGKA